MELAGQAAGGGSQVDVTTPYLRRRKNTFPDVFIFK